MPAFPSDNTYSDILKRRDDFPLLNEKFHEKPLVYFDNAATTQKPMCVIEAIQDYYLHSNANIHRGVYALSERATHLYEGARETVRRFLNARSTKEVIFTSGTTEGINLIAATYGRKNIRENDEILLSGMEHHANIVPWKRLCEETGARLKVIPLTENGELDLQNINNLFTERTKILSVTHVSNALGTINPIQTLIELAQARGVTTVIDGAQAVGHLPIDVQALHCDFYVFSGHKIFGPTGIGVLYGKESLLEAMPPYQSGGDMIKQVSFETITYNDLPHKFEAGTPHISGAIGLGRALQYLMDLPRDRVAQYESALLAYLTKSLNQDPSIRIIGQAHEKISIVSFVMNEVHPHDIATILDESAIAVRAGHHCAMPLMEFFKVPATIRASLSFYNTFEEIDRLMDALKTVRGVFHL